MADGGFPRVTPSSSFSSRFGAYVAETKKERQGKDLMLLWDITCSPCRAYCLKAVVDLRIPDILDEAGGELTAGEVASKLPSTTVNVGFLSRTLTYAALCGIFDLPSEEAELEESAEADHGKGDPDVEGRKFALNSFSRLFVDRQSTEPDPKRRVSHTPTWLVMKRSLDVWAKIGDGILTGTVPFVLDAGGLNLFEVAKVDPAWTESFMKVMASSAGVISESVVEAYDGLKGVKVAVDVGGGLGALMTSISRLHPEIRCINFDLPHVIAEAPEIPGVEHVSGDMFKSVPEGDAIFIKSVLHDWDEEECVRILKNCWKALPKNGKVLIVEGILAPPSEAAATDYALEMALLAFTNGLQRTERQWRRILLTAGFRPIFSPPSYMSIIEGHKS